MIFCKVINLLTLILNIDFIDWQITEGDRALLYFKSQRLLLTKPLRRDDKTATKYGDVRHDNLIGKHIREIVSIGKNRELWARLPSLEEYITMTPRLVTPVSTQLFSNA